MRFAFSVGLVALVGDFCFGAGSPLVPHFRSGQFGNPRSYGQS
jgi:hypothetical protein